jgi:hypothetical protein
MTLADFGTIAEIVSAFAVVITLAYLAIQTRFANKLAQMQTRQHIADSAREELAVIIADPEVLLKCNAPPPISPADAARVANFLIMVIRQREWEWYQAANGAISAEAAEQVKRDCLEVAALFLDMKRARKWWEMTGRVGYNPQFVAELDAFLEGRSFLDPIADYMAIEAALVEDSKRTPKRKPKTART